MNFISIADFSKEGLISLVSNALEMKKSRKRSEILGGLAALTSVAAAGLGLGGVALQENCKEIKYG